MSSSGRLFSNYPSGLDPENTNDGSNNKYAVAELFANNTERPYPSAEFNNPPGGSINYTTNPPSKSTDPIFRKIVFAHATPFFQAERATKTTS